MAKTNLLSRYVRVSPDYTCPICGHDNWCLVNQEGTGAICSRESSDSPRGDAGHFHWLDGSAPPPVEAKQRKDLLPKSRIRTFQKIWERQITDELLGELADQLGLWPSSLRQVGTGWRGDCYTFPMYDSFKEIMGYRLRSPSGKKWTLGGTENGIFRPTVEAPFPNPLLVCEGPTDMAAALQLGFEAIGRPNNISLKEETKKLIVQSRAKHVTIVADGDDPGISGAVQLQEYLRPQVEAEVYVPVKHNDLREYVAAGNQTLDARDWRVL